jgi:hypothetical protein
MASFPCPCCGHLTLSEQRMYDLCDVCFWEDDLNQLSDPTSPRGANGYSLIDGQASYIETGASHVVFLDKVREPTESEPLDPGWRPVNLAIDRFEPGRDEIDGHNPTATELYYWRPSYWLAPK